MLSAALLAACSTTIKNGQTIPQAVQGDVALAEAVAQIGSGVTVPTDVPHRLEQAVMKQAAQRPTGKVPVKLNMTITQYDIASNGARLFAGAFMGSNKLYVAVDVLDAQSGAVLGHYDVEREANPGGYGAFYDQVQATIDETAEGVVNGLYGQPKS